MAKTKCENNIIYFYLAVHTLTMHFSFLLHELALSQIGTAIQLISTSFVYAI